MTDQLDMEVGSVSDEEALEDDGVAPAAAAEIAERNRVDVADDLAPRDPGHELTYQPVAGLDVQRLMDSAVSKDSVEVLTQLMQLRREEMALQAKAEFNRAFSAFHREMPPVPRDTRGKELAAREGDAVTVLMYAGLETIQHHADPILAKHGFSYSFTVPEASPKSLKVVCALYHEGGHERESQTYVPISAIPRATEGQQFTGARTTGKRLTLSDVLGIATEDCGGELESGDARVIDEDQYRILQELVEKKAVDIDELLGFAGVESLSDVLVSQFGMLRRFLEHRKDREAVE